MNKNYYVNLSKEIEAEDYREDEEYSSLKTKKSRPQKSIILALIGVGIVAGVMLFVWFWEQPQNSVSAKRIQMLENRIAQLEKKLSKVAEMEIALAEMASRNQKLELTLERFDRFETSTSLQLDLVNKELSNLKSIKAATEKQPEPQPTAPEIIPEKPAIKYHTVTAGDTLYSISRQYGLTVDELRRVNKLDAESTIRPRQQLRVSPERQ